jgi:hypothetical protein
VTLAVVAVDQAPMGLVRVKVRMADGTLRQVLMPRRLLGVEEVTITVQAMAGILAWQEPVG